MNIVIIIIVFFATLLTIFLAWLYMMAPRMKNRVDFKEFKKYFYAHRGFHKQDKSVPENSLAAFKAAVENGYGMEFDIQLTKDEQVVVHHDHSLKRMCGVDLNVSELTYEEILQYNLLNTTEKVPLLSELLEIVDGKTPLIVELKSHTDTRRLCELCDEMLKNYKGLYCIESFDVRTVEWFKNNSPETVRGQLMTKTSKNPPEGVSKFSAFLAENLCSNFMTRPDFEAYDYKKRNNLALRLCKKLFKIQEVSWTVRDKATNDSLTKDGSICIFEFFIP